jgi:hypothetical protein
MSSELGEGPQGGAIKWGTRVDVGLERPAPSGFSTELRRDVAARQEAAYDRLWVYAEQIVRNGGKSSPELRGKVFDDCTIAGVPPEHFAESMLNIVAEHRQVPEPMTAAELEAASAAHKQARVDQAEFEKQCAARRAEEDRARKALEAKTHVLGARVTAHHQSLRSREELRSRFRAKPQTFSAGN